MSTDEEQADLEQERGYGAAEDDVNEDTPAQAQQHHPDEAPEGSDATGDAFTEETRRVTETGPGEDDRRGA